MPYKAKGKCVYKKDSGKKVGCTKGDVNDYLAALHMHADESVQKEGEELVGGKADKMSAADIAKKHGVSIDKIKDQLRKGIKTEKEEHSKSKKTAKEIAMDHLTEIPSYYDKLTKMEKSEKINEDIFQGGKADDKTPEDIAEYHDVSIGQIENQLRLGTRIELHHVDSEAEARELAMDHLMEIPDYYDRLIQMQRTAARDTMIHEGTETSKQLIKRLIRENLLKK